MKSKQPSLLTGCLGIVAVACTAPQPAPTDVAIIDAREAATAGAWSGSVAQCTYVR
ncbi:MAG: hypothetical protein JNK05_12360 [Myxococcales bacterium]|nr:hypothetical protein [Myxococcales bacterium]